MRITNNRKGAEKHLNRIKKYIPTTGTVRIIRLTEKQFCNMGLYQFEEDLQESVAGITTCNFGGASYNIDEKIPYESKTVDKWNPEKISSFVKRHKIDWASLSEKYDIPLETFIQKGEIL